MIMKLNKVLLGDCLELIDKEFMKYYNRFKDANVPQLTEVREYGEQIFNLTTKL